MFFYGFLGLLLLPAISGMLKLLVGIRDITAIEGLSIALNIMVLSVRQSYDFFVEAFSRAKKIPERIQKRKKKNERQQNV